MADTRYSSIDSQLANLSITGSGAAAAAAKPKNVREENPFDSVDVPQNSYYNILSPQLDQAPPAAPNASPFPPNIITSPKTAKIGQQAVFSQFSPTQPTQTAQTAQTSLHYNNRPSGVFSNPTSRMNSPPLPTELQFNHQTQVQKSLRQNRILASNNNGTVSGNNSGENSGDSNGLNNFGYDGPFSPLLMSPTSPSIPSLPTSPVSGTTVPGMIQKKKSKRKLPVNIPDERHYYQDEFRNKDFLTFQMALPPPATTIFRAADQGTASPKFMSLSMYNLPLSEKIRSVTKLPVALNFRPFAPVESEGDKPVPLVSDENPVRCSRCKCFMNSTVQFTRSNKFICNLCQFATDLPEHYICALDDNFRRLDHFQRPELNYGVVEFAVDDQYWEVPQKQPLPLHSVYLIDVSSSAMEKGLHRVACDAIRASLYGSEEEPGREADFDSSDLMSDDGAIHGTGISFMPETSFGSELGPESDPFAEKQPEVSNLGKVCIITYDKNIHLYNLSSQLQNPSVSIISDLEDESFFLPFWDGLFVDPNESRDIIERTLCMIESSSKFERYSEIAFGAAINFARYVIDEVTEGQGGKIYATLSSIPSQAPGLLSLRKYQVFDGTKEHDKEKLVLTANSEYYTKFLAEKFLKSKVGLDLFAFPSFGMDLINASHITKITGGQLKLYPNFVSPRDERRVIFEFKKAMHDTVGYQSHVKVRCSKGLQLKEIYGNFKDFDNVLPVLSKNSVFDVLFNYDGTLNVNLDCHFQASVLYTTVQGERRVRVINLVSAIAQRVSDIFSYVNQDVLVGLIIKDCLAHIPDQPFESIKQSIDNKLCNILSQYRINCVSDYALSLTLVIPDGLKTLPNFLLAFEKAQILRKVTSTVLNNLRVYNRHNLMTLPLPQLSYYLYPLIVEIHSLGTKDCEFYRTSSKRYERLRMPKGIIASRSSLEIGGCYLSFNGLEILIWVHPDVNPLLLQDLFGVDSFKSVDSSIDELPQLDTEISNKVNNLVRYIGKRIVKVDFMPVRVIKSGVDDQLDFFNLMVDDRTSEGVSSYQEYLNMIHKNVKTQFESANKTTSIMPNLSGLLG